MSNRCTMTEIRERVALFAWSSSCCTMAIDSMLPLQALESEDGILSALAVYVSFSLLDTI